MRFGLKVNPVGWPEAVEWAGLAEEAGFDGVWTGDNLRNPRDPAIAVQDGPTVITGWGAVTERIRVGLLIGNVVFRHPVVLAKQALSIDHVSGGRFEFGIGAGLWPTDHAMAGEPLWTARERSARLAEFVAVVDRLLAGDESDHDGPYYPYAQASMTPGPVQDRIPLIVAANAPKGLAVAAAHGDGWVTFTGAAGAEEFYQASVERVRLLDEAAAGRKLRRILLAYGTLDPWASPDAFARLVDRYRGIGFDELVLYTPKEHERAVFDRITAQLDRYR